MSFSEPARSSLRSVAEALFEAYSTRVGISPPRVQRAQMSVEDAYVVQQFQREMFEAAGHTVIGHKIGLTSEAMQRQLGVDSPDFGFITDKMLLAPGEGIVVTDFLSPKIEPELGFKLGKDLGPHPSFAEIEAAVESIHLAVELIDSRVDKWDISLFDTIADNASCGAIILDPRPVSIPSSRLAAVPARLLIDAHLHAEGTSAAVMGHPLRPVQWLAEMLGRMGTSLRKGELILSGSFCAAAPIAAGQTIEVDYGPFGTLRTHCI